MKAGVKVVLVVVLVLAVLVGASLFFFGDRGLGALVKQVVERGGTYAMGVRTTLAEAEVDSGEGRVTMEGLRVDNPQGFQANAFMTLTGGSVRVVPASILREVVEVPELTLAGIELNLERTADGANYQAILDSLKRFESGEKAEPDPGEQEGGKKFVVQKLVIRDVSVSARLLGTGNEAIDDAAAVELELPVIELAEVGSAADPMTAGEIVSLVIKTLIQSSLEIGGNRLPTEMLADLQSGLEQLSSLRDMGVEALAGVQDTLDQAMSGVGEDLRRQGEERLNDAVDDIRRQGEDRLRDGLDRLMPGGGGS